VEWQKNYTKCLAAVARTILIQNIETIFGCW